MGGNKANYLDTVYKYEAKNESWTLMPERMSQPKHAVAAFLVNPEEFPSCG